MIVGRRDAKGADLGYWRYPLVSGVDVKQIAPDGAPGLGSVAIGVEGLTGQKGRPQWASRAALTADGTTMLVVRGADNVAEIVDVTGARPPIKLILQGNSSPVWVQSDAAFYLAATSDKGHTWYLWRITPDGLTTNPRSAAGDIGTTGMSGRSSLAWIMKAGDGVDHLAYADVAGGVATLALRTMSGMATHLRPSRRTGPPSCLGGPQRARPAARPASGRSTRTARA